MDFQTAKALLEWQVELGANEATGETPINRYELPDALIKPRAKAATPPARVVEKQPDEIAADGARHATQVAKNAPDLAALRQALESFEHCELKRGAKTTVFGDGDPGARVMIIGEAPGRDEDIQGRPFVGRAGQLLDKMLGAIGMARDGAGGDPVYITNVLPWRPPQNRDPRPDEIAMLLPFVKRHVELVAPEILVLMGNVACQALLGRKGITRLRANWTTALGLPVMAMFHPDHLLRNPQTKREAWHDLLMLQAKLKEG